MASKKVILQDSNWYQFKRSYISWVRSFSIDVATTLDKKALKTYVEPNPVDPDDSREYDEYKELRKAWRQDTRKFTKDSDTVIGDLIQEGTTISLTVSKAIRRNREAFNKIIEDKDILGLWALLEQACLHNANTMLVFHRQAFDRILQGNKESFDNYIERFEDAVETLVDYTATISEDEKRDKMMLGLDKGRYIQLFNDIMLRPPVPDYQGCKDIILNLT